MKKIRIQRDPREMDSIISLTIRWFIAIMVFFLILLSLGSCGGSGSGSTSQSSDTPSGSDSAALSVTAASSTSINLSWTNPADSYLTSPEDVYSDIYRGGVKIGTTHGFSYNDTGLQPESSYCYTVYVTAVYWFITYTSYTWLSNSACATTMADTQSPSVPVNVSATALSASTIKLAWDNSTDNNAVSGYRIYRAGAFLMTSAGTAVTDNTVTSNTSYCYTVSAYDAAGNESAQSSAACATTMVSDYIIDSAADGPCYNNSMTIDSTDALHLAYINGNTSGGYELRYATNASGAWAVTALDNSWGYPSIAADASDRVHIASQGDYISNATGTWVTEILPEQGTVPSIAVDRNGKAHMSFSIETTTPLGYADRSIKYATNLSGSWVTEPVSKTNLIPAASLALDSNAKAHIAFGDGYPSAYYLEYATNVSGAWQQWSIAGPLPWDGGCEFGGLRPSVVVDPADKVHIAVGNIYVTNTSGSWKAETFDPAGSCPSLTLDLSKNPHIVYKAYDADIAAYRLKHATRGQGGWSNAALSVISQPSGFFSIAVDSSGGIHVSYCNGNDIVYLKEP